jgi:hypothetical protein
MNRLVRELAVASIVCAGLSIFGEIGIRAQEPAPTRRDAAAAHRSHELTKFSAAEAHQGVAVDKSHFYAISNRTIGKYDKETGNFVARWDAPVDSPLKHLNSGVVIDGKLYCAHSNWPSEPLQNSIEIWEAATLKHVERRRLDEPKAAVTWIDRHDDAWWIVFASYGTKQHVRRTSLVRLDDAWNRVASWTFPDEVVERFVPFSCSGGSWGPDGLLYVTGHDRAETYAIRVPDQGASLKLMETVSIPMAERTVESCTASAVLRRKSLWRDSHANPNRARGESRRPLHSLFASRQFTFRGAKQFIRGMPLANRSREDRTDDPLLIDQKRAGMRNAGSLTCGLVVQDSVGFDNLAVRVRE